MKRVAFLRGDYGILTPGGVTLDQSEYPEVWERVSGVWLVYRDICNSSMPQAVRESQAEEPAAPGAG